MITCPECGQEAADGAKFCDRCGQGLSSDERAPAARSLAALQPGAELKGGYRIIELISQTAHENRYRAERGGENGPELRTLREQAGPAGPSGITGETAPPAPRPPGEDRTT